MELERFRGGQKEEGGGRRGRGRGRARVLF